LLKLIKGWIKMPENQKTSNESKAKVTFIKNVKYNEKRYKIGDSLSVTKKEREYLLEAGVIEQK